MGFDVATENRVDLRLLVSPLCTTITGCSCVQPKAAVEARSSLKRLSSVSESVENSAVRTRKFVWRFERRGPGAVWPNGDF